MRSRETINDEPLPVADDFWWSGLTIEERMDADPSRYFQESWRLSYIEAARQIHEEDAMRAQAEAKNQSKAEKRPKHAGTRRFGGDIIGLLRNMSHTPQHRENRDL